MEGLIPGVIYTDDEPYAKYCEGLVEIWARRPMRKLCMLSLAAAEVLCLSIGHAVEEGYATRTYDEETSKSE